MGTQDPIDRGVLAVPRKVRAARERIDLERRSILEPGCGRGTYLEHLPAGSLGLDRDPQAVAACRSKGLRAEARDVERAGWGADLGRFDLIWTCDLLPHLDEPRAFLAALHGVLAPGGSLLVHEWLWPEGALRRRLALLLPGAGATWSAPEHRRAYTARTLEADLAAAGFEVVERWIPALRRPWQRLLLDPIWPSRAWRAVPRT